MANERVETVKRFANMAKDQSFHIAVMAGRTAELHALLANPATSTDEAMKAIKQFHDNAYDAGQVGVTIGLIAASGPSLKRGA